jgi:hypothetical protein
MFGSLPQINHHTTATHTTSQYIVFSAEPVAATSLATSCGAPQFGVATGGRQPSRQFCPFSLPKLFFCSDFKVISYEQFSVTYILLLFCPLDFVVLHDIYSPATFLSQQNFFLDGLHG